MKCRDINFANKVIFLGLFCFIVSVAQTSPQQNPGLLKINSENLTRVGNWPFGSALAVAVDTARQLAYLGSGGAVLVLDVSNLSQPQLISDVINTKGKVTDLRYNHLTQHLYVAAVYEDFQIWDMQDPDAPRELCQYELPTPYADPVTNGVDFYNNYAITENNYLFVNSINVADPKNPFLVSGNDDMGNPARAIHVAVDGMLHTGGAYGYVEIYIGPNGSLNTSNEHDLDFGCYEVFGTSDAAFIRTDRYLGILDPSSIYAPAWSFTDIGFFSDIFIQENYAYITNNNQMLIYDVTNYQNPFLEGSITLPGFSEKLEVYENYAYLAGGHSGLRNINIKNPAQPVEEGFYETFSATTDMDRAGDYGYITELDDGMLVLDLSNISHPTLVAQYNSPGNAVALEVVDNLAYIADGDGGLRIADVSDPLNPTEVGAYDSLNYAQEVCISGNYAYVVDNIINQPDWIRAFDISNPANPISMGGILMQSDIYALDASGNYLYAAATDKGMRVLDISDPANLVEAGYFLAPKVFDVCVQGNYAYLASADWDGGFVTVDISDPTNPIFISTYNENGWFHPFDVAVQGDYAYVGDPVGNEFLLFYIGDPANPSQLGAFRLSGDVSNLFAKDSLVYVSDGVAGVQIVENHLYSTSGAGITWQQQLSGTAYDLWSVYFINDSIGWTVGNEGTIVTTHDGGQTWQQQNSGVTAELFGVFFIDENNGWAVGREGSILHTINGGNQWTSQSSGTNLTLRSVTFIDNTQGWIVGEDGIILYTMNGGTNWQNQNSSTTSYLDVVDFVDANHGWVACGTLDGSILKTNNGGASWQIQYVPTQDRIYTLDFVDQNTGWVGTTGVEVLKTTDGGSSWTLQYQNSLHPYDVFSAMCFVDQNFGLAVGYDGRITNTVDGGNTWVEQTSGVHNYLTGVCFVDQYHGWVVGKEGLILKAKSAITFIGNHSISQESTPDKFFLFNNYPNPFNPVTTIQYDVPHTTRIVLKIYDMLGQQVKTLVDEAQAAGYKSVIWDGRNDNGIIVGSGIYFYRLQSNDILRTKKMMLMR